MKFINWPLLQMPLHRAPWRRFSTVTATTIALTAGLTAGMVPSASAFFGFDLEPDIEDFNACASDLTSKGIDDSTAADVCGRALYPSDLGQCVVGIEHASLSASTVLVACTQVRRPDELPSCFNAILGQDNAASGENVLDNCRRSLLPQRFANCVVGLRQEVALSTDEVMASCIAAGDRPRNVIPSFQRF